MPQKQQIQEKINNLVLLTEQEKKDLIGQLDRLNSETLNELDELLNTELQHIAKAVKTVYKKGDHTDMGEFLSGLSKALRDATVGVNKVVEGGEREEEEEKAKNILSDI
jgi:CHASE3 domain sensor protein